MIKYLINQKDVIRKNKINYYKNVLFIKNFISLKIALIDELK